MPRAARKVSSTGIYHVMIRGINKEKLFLDEKDKEKFIEILIKIKKDLNYDLYAYCLMENHAHFLINEKEQSISQIMKSICGIYGGWFNYRHHRVGHLFQDRFKSECVESDSYFISVLKYILNNPVKAKLVTDPQDYKWSNYNEYTKKKKFTDTEFFLTMLHKNERIAKKIFIEEIKKDMINIVNLTIDNTRRSDRDAEEIINMELKNYHTENVGELSIENRILFIKNLLAKGVTKRQIMGITGLTKSQVVGI